MHHRTSHHDGFTMMEMTVVLMIIAVLAAVLVPVVSNYVDQARIARAQSDARAIGEAIARFEKDVGRYPMWSTANAALQDSTANVATLRGPGAVPNENPATAWTNTTPTSDTDCTPNCVWDDLEDQLLLNAPVYATTDSLAKPFKWKGPYLDADMDPWGRAYLVNIINCKSGSSDACFVISAGPNEKVETSFNPPRKGSVVPTNDDIIYRIR